MRAPKSKGYEPPAHWEWVRKIRDAVNIPVTANGDVFSLQDYLDIKNRQRLRQRDAGSRRGYPPRLGAANQAI